MRNLLKIGLLLIPFIGVSLTPVAGMKAADSDAKAVFESRCSTCHPTSRPLSKTKSEAEWRQTVMKMKTYASGRISDEEAESIIAYLTEVRGK